MLNPRPQTLLTPADDRTLICPQLRFDGSLQRHEWQGSECRICGMRRLSKSARSRH